MALSVALQARGPIRSRRALGASECQVPPPPPRLASRVPKRAPSGDPFRPQGPAPALVLSWPAPDYQESTHNQLLDCGRMWPANRIVAVFSNLSRAFRPKRASTSLSEGRFEWLLRFVQRITEVLTKRHPRLGVADGAAAVQLHFRKRHLPKTKKKGQRCNGDVAPTRTSRANEASVHLALSFPLPDAMMWN